MGRNPWGMHDECIKAAFSFNNPSGSGEAGLEFLKHNIREKIRPLFENLAFLEAKKNAEEFKKRNQPHTLGTVAEIAAKSGISKSEVRRLKQEGRLEENLMMIKLQKETS